MKWKLSVVFWMVMGGYGLSAQQAATLNAESNRTNSLSLTSDCTHLVFVESPKADTYTSSRDDTVNYGSAISMRLRGIPEKKSMVSHLAYELHHIDPNYVQSCFLKLYTVSKSKETTLSVSGVDKAVDEQATSWHNQPQAQKLISSKALGDKPFVEFEVTDFVKNRLKTGYINFVLQSDGKKPIEISSRESGLGSELIIDLCSPVPMDLLVGKSSKEGPGYGMKILPCQQVGKFTVELVGVPAGGFGDLMIMEEGGKIIRRVPLAVRDGDVLYHSVDYGDILPGEYWAVFRKGRVMVKDQFRLRPAKNMGVHLEVELEIDEQPRQVSKQ